MSFKTLKIIFNSFKLLIIKTIQMRLLVLCFGSFRTLLSLTLMFL